MESDMLLRALVHSDILKSRYILWHLYGTDEVLSQVFKPVQWIIFCHDINVIYDYGFASMINFIVRMKYAQRKHAHFSEGNLGIERVTIRDEWKGSWYGSSILGYTEIYPKSNFLKLEHMIFRCISSQNMNIMIPLSYHINQIWCAIKVVFAQTLVLYNLYIME